MAFVHETHAGQYIEPVQLQVVCYQLWQRLADTEPGPITDQDLERSGNVDDALAEFYQQALAEVIGEAPGTREGELRDWFDRKLITEAGTRGTVFMGLEQTAGMSNCSRPV